MREKMQKEIGVTPQQVYRHVLDFFVAACGTESDSGLRPETGQPCLLRTACMGNPERTMQGELFAYLKQQEQLRPVLEYRHHRLDKELDGGNDRGNSIDIMVFDCAYRPVVAVELKHHSRQQGTLTRLQATLEADRDRLDKLVIPSIQVGLYTELLCLGTPVAGRETYQDFRFITAYAYKQDKAGIHRLALRPTAKPPDPAALHEWAKPLFQPFISCFGGRAESFVTQDGAVVKGRVNYIIGLSSYGVCTALPRRGYSTHTATKGAAEAQRQKSAGRYA
jgi:hypothetical protein